MIFVTSPVSNAADIIEGQIGRSTYNSNNNRHGKCNKDVDPSYSKHVHCILAIVQLAHYRIDYSNMSKRCHNYDYDRYDKKPERIT